MADICNFQTFIQLMNRKIMRDMNPFDPNRQAKQEDLIYALFYSYYEDHDTVCSQTSGSLYFSGNLGIPKAIKNYYKETSNQNKLRGDIALNIIPWLENADDTVAALIKLIHDAEEIGENQFRELAAFQSNSVELIARITLHAMRQKHYPTKPAELSNPQTRALTDARRHRPPQPCEWFCGRERELAELHDLLQAHSCVFVRGIDGIGKSEFMKKYAAVYGDVYDVRFFWFTGSLAETFSEFGDSEDAIIDALETVATNVLIIIDNYNPQDLDDPLLLSFTDLPCRVIFTTPCAIDDVIIYELCELSENDLLKLFRTFYPKADLEQKFVKKIIRALHSYTFAVELAARILGKGFSSPSEILHHLNRSSASSSIWEKIRIRRRNRSSYQTYHDHLSALFHLFSFSDNRQHYLKNCCFFPESGCSQTMAVGYLGTTIEPFCDLIDLGLLRLDSNEILSMHSLLADLVIEDLKPTVSDCFDLITSLAYYFRMTDENLKNTSELLAIGQRICGHIEIDQAPVYIDFLFAMFFYLDKTDRQNDKKMLMQELNSMQSEMTKADLDNYTLAKDKLYPCEESFASQEARLLQQEAGITDGAQPEIAGLIYSSLGQLYVNSKQPEKAERSFKKALPFYLQVIEKNRKSGVIPAEAVTFIMAYTKLLFADSRPVKQQKAEKLLKQLIDDAGTHPVDDIEIYADFAQKLLQHLLITNRSQEYAVYYQKAKLLFQKFYPENPEQVSRLCGRCEFALVKYVTATFYQT